MSQKMMVSKETKGLYNKEFDSNELGKLLSVTNSTINIYAREGMPCEEKVNEKNAGWNKKQLKRYFIVSDALNWILQNKPKTKAAARAKELLEEIN